jgi:hypothetical protein
MRVLIRKMGFGVWWGGGGCAGYVGYASYVDYDTYHYTGSNT